MKSLCSKSGILFQTQYFPYTDETAKSIHHPVFEIPQKKLLSMVTRFTSGDLSEIDSYLLYLALLNSTGQVEFRVPTRFTDRTSSIVYNNMEDLVLAVGQLNLISHPSFVVAKIAITKENNTLENSHFWIKSWMESVSEFKRGVKSDILKRDLSIRELALEKLIKSQHNETQLAVSLANWAEIAGNFPTFTVSSPFGDMPLADYWKLIIRKCVNAESIFSVPTADIQELIEHCEDNIEHGTIYAHSLMSLLRNGKNKNTDFLGLGDWDESTDTLRYVFVEGEDSVEKANLQLLVNSAPTSEPSITDYPSKFEWLKAHTKWKIASALQGGTNNE